MPLSKLLMFIATGTSSWCCHLVGNKLMISHWPLAPYWDCVTRVLFRFEGGEILFWFFPPFYGCGHVFDLFVFCVLDQRYSFSFICWFVVWSICLFIRLFVYLFTYLIICSFIHLFNCTSIHHSSTYLLRYINFPSTHLVMQNGLNKTPNLNTSKKKVSNLPISFRTRNPNNTHKHPDPLYEARANCKLQVSTWLRVRNVKNRICKGL